MPTPARPARALLRRLAAGVQLAAATALAALVVAPPAAAQSGSVATPASIQVVNAPGIALHIPADGRLHGDGFAAQVTGYRFANQIGYGPSTVKAARGQRLLVFGLEGAPLAPQTDSQGDTTPAVSALLDVDGAQQPLPAASTTQAAPTYFLASIPANAGDVALDLSNQGFTQTFSFTAGARQGPQPAVVYRAQSSWQATDPVGQTITMATPDPSENIPGAAIDVTLTSANLTWFGPDAPSHNPSYPEQAWLVLDMKSQPHSIAALASGYELNYLSTLSPSQVTLTVPGQATPVPATIAGKGGPVDESQDQSGFFGGVYFWQVPADLTSATVKITPGAITAESNWLGSPQAITVAGTAAFPLSFAPPYQPPPPPASPPADASGRVAVALTTASPHRSSGGFPLLTLLSIPVLILIGGTGLVTRRRHDRKVAAARPVSDPSRPPEPSRHPATGPPPKPAESPAASSRSWPAGDAVAARPFQVTPPFQTAPHPTAGSRSNLPAATNGSARPSLLVPPETPPEPPPGTVRVDVLGTRSITGWPPESPPRQSVMEIMAFLVLHPNQRFTADQLQTGLSIGRPRDLSADSIRRYINEPRRALGEHHVPETKPGEGYWLRDVTSDAAQMADLIQQARSAPTPAVKARHLADALALVRGAPFAEVPNGTYGWADTDTDLGPAMGRQIRQAAIELTQIALDARDAVLTDWATEKGLRVWPTDDDLLEPRLAAARLNGVPALDVAWTETNKHLHRHDTTPSDRLRAAYRSLRNEGLPTEERPG